MKRLTGLIACSCVVLTGLCCLSVVVAETSYDPVVYQAQKKLQDLGYTPGRPDGLMGEKTLRALRDFQRNAGLPVTGRLDSETRAKLGIGSPSRGIPLGSLATEKRVALVIGNGSYASAPLANPPNDAADIAEVLRGLGFDVIERIDADKRQMILFIDAFFKNLRRADVGLFYYAGHGMQIQNRNYLIPVKAHVTSETDVQFEAVDAGRVLGKMQDAGSNLNLVILDACRDNPFKRSFRTGKAGLAQMDAPKGTIVAYATSPGSVAADGAGRNGIYTKHLLKNIQRPGLSIQDVLMETGLAVMRETDEKQVPWISSTPVPRFFLAGGKAEEERHPEPGEEDTSKGSLYISTTPRGATVWLDGARLGNAPVEVGGLEPGSYQIKVQKDGFKVWKKRVEVLPGKQVLVEAKLVTGMEFVWVPGGCYEMGSPSGERGRDSDEGPVHEVCVDGFWMGKYEVTIGQYQQFLRETGETSGVDWKDEDCPLRRDGSYSLSGNRFGRSQEQPMVEVSWKGAKAFSEWLSRRKNLKFRLPTEAEWEYACRGGTDTARSWGDDPDNACRYANVHDLTSKRVNKFDWENHNCEDGYAVTAPVGSFKPNGFGLYDMLGNVWEWCEDIYSNKAYSKHQRNNPIYTYGGSGRVVRGGSWPDEPRYVRCAIRNHDHPGNALYDLGFRLVRIE